MVQKCVSSALYEMMQTECLKNILIAKIYGNSLKSLQIRAKNKNRISTLTLCISFGIDFRIHIFASAIHCCFVSHYISNTLYRFAWIL